MKDFQTNCLNGARFICVMAAGVVSMALLDTETLAIELLRNGSFEFEENDNPPLNNAAWVDGSNIENDMGFAHFEYPHFSHGEPQHGCSCFELPPGALGGDFEGTVKPNAAGTFFGWKWGTANGNGSSGSATQIVEVTGHSNQLFGLSAWVASLPADDHVAEVSLEFFADIDGRGESLGTILFDGDNQQSEFIVGSLNLDGEADPMIVATPHNWTFYRARGVIPTDALSAAVVISGKRGTDAYVDLVSLQVVPEPSSVLLVIVSAVVMLVGTRVSLCSFGPKS